MEMMTNRSEPHHTYMTLCLSM